MLRNLKREQGLERRFTTRLVPYIILLMTLQLAEDKLVIVALLGELQVQPSANFMHGDKVTGACFAQLLF